MEPYWGEVNGHAQHPLKYESDTAVAGFPYCSETGLNFSTSGTAYSEDDAEFAPGRRGKTSRQDPLSHRIIEKRRRDRMNSCLADLSRLIPPQYQRKGRGRIEKTEIIEMAIRHLKHLQNECVHKEIEYKLGFTDCMKEAAKFLYENHMQDLCYQLINHLQERCEEFMKSDCFKARCQTDTISASSGSPNNNAHPYHHPTTPLSQLRGMLSSEHSNNSNDHNDVKDLSFRNQPHQAAVITSTAPPLHHDTSNHDFSSAREMSSSGGTMRQNDSIMGNSPPLHDNGAVRLRRLSESSHDIEHNNNYKYKNDIKQRFHQDSHVTHHDESTSDHTTNHASNESISNDKLTITPTQAKLSEISNQLSILNCKKRKLSSCEIIVENGNDGCEEKPPTSAVEVKSEGGAVHQQSSTTLTMKIPTVNNGSGRHFTVPIFALHSQGSYYIPLNVAYDALIPYLHGIDLLNKNLCTTIPSLHPININVNFSIHSTAFNRQNGILSKPKTETIITNGW